MARIDGLGSRGPAQSSEELHEKNERNKVVDKAIGGGDEAHSVTDADGNRRVVGPADAERLMSQAGYSRSGKKKKTTDFDMGDAAGAPIPLPEDDVDASLWSQEALGAVQTQMGLQGAALGRARSRGEGRLKKALSMWAELIGEATGGEEESDSARLQALPTQTPPDAAGLAAMAASAQAHFGLDLAGLSPGSQLAAASLLVAGHKEHISVLPQTDAADGAAGRELDGERLLTGLQAVVDNSRAAVDDGRRMNEGVAKQLAMHRTFVAKR